MNNDNAITRRAVLAAAALGASEIIAPNQKAYGEIIDQGWTGPDLQSLSIEVDKEHPILTPAEYLNSLKASSTHFPNKDRLWQTCALDDSGNVVVLKTHESIDDSFEWLNAENVILSMEESGISVDKIISRHSGIQPRAVSASISVLGGVLLGYLFGVVVDGIVISATGESTAYWFAQALQNTLQKALSPDRITRISCSLYLGMGSIYFNCMWGAPIN